MDWRRPGQAVLVLAALIFVLVHAPRPALALVVGGVIVSPSVVAVPASAAQKTAILISATVAGVAPGATSSCTVTLTLQPSGTVLAVSPAVNTSPAPASGTTSVSVQMLVPGLTPPGPAQATVSCGGSSASTPFRISALVGLSVAPPSVPAGGVVSLTVMLASGGTLVTTPCSILVTDPSGAAPPILATTLASASVNVTLPPSVAVGTANASVSCVVPNFGTAGDSVDFSVTSPSVVSILSVTSPAVVGTNLLVTAVTIPGFVCVATLTPPAGLKLLSSSSAADATGTVTNTIPVPAALPTGSGSVSVTCTDPTNPANTATSSSQSVTIASNVTPAPSPSPTTAPSPSPTTTPTLSASLVNTAQPLEVGGLASVALAALPGSACSVTNVNAGNGSLPIVDGGASGVVPAAGMLTLSFHLPAATATGTAVAVVVCMSAGTQVGTQVTFLAGSAPTAVNCEGLSGPVGAAASIPVARPGSGYAANAGQPLRFTGAGSLPSAGAVLTTCVWSFGDGGRATTLNPVHTFAAPGLYTVSLTVSDSAGLSATATTTATIGAYMPLCSQPSLTGTIGLGACLTGPACGATSVPAQCLPLCQTYIPANLPAAASCPQPATTVQVQTGGPYAGQALQPLTFRGAASVSGTRRLCAPDATLGLAGPVCNLVPATDLPSPFLYTWNFGDGVEATGAVVTHAYSASGTYDITLTVTFDDQSRAIAITVAQISAPASGGGP